MRQIELWVLDEARLAMNLRELSPTDDLWEKGLDSYSAKELVERLNSEPFSVLVIDDLLRCRTVEKVTARLRSLTPTDAHELILNGKGRKPVLFSVPGVGGYPSDYVHLARALGGDQPMHIFLDDYLDSKDLTVDVESRRLAETIAVKSKSGPISIMGFSTGGVIAFEAARILMASGRDVNLLLVDERGRWSRDLRPLFSDYLGRRDGDNIRIEHLFRRRARIAISLIKDQGIVAGLVAIWKKFPRYRYQSLIFVLSSGKFPAGERRHQFLAQRTLRLRKNYFPQPLKCRAVYFSAMKNPAAQRWTKIIPNLVIVEVGGDHNTRMPHPT